MSQIIFGVLALILFVALAGAGVYYGGSIFGNSSTKADAASIANASSQIVGAWQLYSAENGGNQPANIAALAPTYLDAAPATPSSIANAYVLDTDSATTGDTNTGVILDLDTSSNLCLEIHNKVNGTTVTTLPASNIIDGTSITNLDGAVNANTPYDCYQITATGGGTVGGVTLAADDYFFYQKN